MKKLCLAIFILMAVCFMAESSYAMKFYVYCANGKIEVDSRDPQKMKSARGSSTYMLSEFDYLMDANNFAKKFGGVGASCPKK